MTADHQVRIEKWVYGGDGLGRLDGRVILAPRVLPGELVRFEAEREKPGLVHAKPIEILEPAPARIAPDCPYFGRCGGCHYQHAGYEYQVEQKLAVLRETLQRVGRIEGPEAINLVAGPPWEYRNRVQLHFDQGEAGFLEAGSHRLCPVERCAVSSPRLNETLASLRTMISDRRFPRFLRSLELFTNETVVQVNVLETAGPRLARSFFDWCAETIPGAGAPALDYIAAGEGYRVGHRSFFQVNRFLIDRLVETALDGFPGGTALDLYAGVGLFSLPLARRGGEVTAVESGAGAQIDLRFNAERAALTIKSVQDAADRYLASLEQPPDFVLADPPRTGLGPAVVGHLVRLRPRHLTIVSCDPATLARDLRGLLDGGFALEHLTMVDLFPQTAHIESVARLRHPGA